MISSFQYNQMLARTGRHTPRSGDENEIGHGGIHEQIMDYCRSKGWLYVHSRTDQKSTCPCGTPDFVIAANGGVTFWIEVKRKGSKPTTEQLGKILMLQTCLGHKAAIVYSFEEFTLFMQGGVIA